MTSEEVAGRLRRFLVEQIPNQGTELLPTTHLLEEWFLDSIGVIETVLFLETEFGIEIGRADVNATNFQSLEALTRLVVQRQPG